MDHIIFCARRPFTIDNSTGYSAEEMAVLNAEFSRRWDHHEFSWFGGVPMSEEEAITTFQHEVAQR